MRTNAQSFRNMYQAHNFSAKMPPSFSISHTSVLNFSLSQQLNVLHLHLVDSHAYPVEQKGERIRKMTQYGAYGPDQIYTQEELKDLVAFANARGVRVVPELDQPAHAGNGWQAFPDDYTVCVNQEPWYDYCVEPPCGQLNPVKKEVVQVLEEIYAEWWDVFRFDTFHLGADEVDLRCYNASPAVTDHMEEKGIPRTEKGFVRVWSDFMSASSSALRRSVPKGHDVDYVVWTSKLTHEEHIDNLPPDQYTVHVWTDATVSEGHGVILKYKNTAGFFVITYFLEENNYSACYFGQKVNIVTDTAAILYYKQETCYFQFFNTAIILLFMSFSGIFYAL